MNWRPQTAATIWRDGRPVKILRVETVGDIVTLTDGSKWTVSGAALTRGLEGARLTQTLDTDHALVTRARRVGVVRQLAAFVLADRRPYQITDATIDHIRDVLLRGAAEVYRSHYRNLNTETIDRRVTEDSARLVADCERAGDLELEGLFGEQRPGPDRNTRPDSQRPPAP